MTKYRTGSNTLKLLNGYYTRTPMNERLCTCNEVQSLEHVIFSCLITAPMRHGNFPANLEEFFQDTRFAADKLTSMVNLLKLRK